MYSLRIFIPGAYENGFAYMDHLLGVGTDRALLRCNIHSLVSDVVPEYLLPLARLHFLRNDLLAQEGTQILLGDPTVRRVVEEKLADAQEAFLGDPDSWSASTDYEALLGAATVLDLQIYNQRLFAGTTSGVIHADLIDDAEEFYFSRPTKRTDARCVSLAIRYGTVAASCESNGLLVSFDEFGELLEHNHEELERAATSSVRASWLGYNLVNYLSATEAVAFKATYDFARWSGGRRDAILVGLREDDRLLADEPDSWVDADFVYNDHSLFFVHHAADSSYELRRRTWRSGRLGRPVDVQDGNLARPLSAHPVLSGLVIETYDSVWLLGRGAPHLLHSGEAIAVRTFPNSVRYKNVILVVDEEGLHLISPMLGDHEQSGRRG